LKGLLVPLNNRAGPTVQWHDGRIGRFLKGTAMERGEKKAGTAELRVELGEGEKLSETINALVYTLTRHGYRGRPVSDVDVHVENARHATLKMNLR
jgi:hypothetical protein